MTVTIDPVTEPMEDAPGPIDQLSALEEVYGEPVRAQYVEGGAILPPQPDFEHNKAAGELFLLER